MNQETQNGSGELREDAFEAPSLAAWRRTFSVLVWAFVFFLPVRIPGLRVLPDLVGWLIVALALTRLQGPPARRWRVLALVAVLLVVARIVVFRLTQSGAAYLLLYTAVLAAGIVFVWQLCGAIARVAERTGYENVSARARLGRWLFVAHVALIYASLLVMHLTGGNIWGLAGAGAALFMNAVILSAMMSLTASAARVCKMEMAAEPAEEEAGQKA